jgi:hypothetical protein
MWGGIHALQTTHVAPPNAQKYPSIVPLKVSQSFFLVGAVCALVVVWFVASEPAFFSFHFSLSSYLKITAWLSWLSLFQH